MALHSFLPNGTTYASKILAKQPFFKTGLAQYGTPEKFHGMPEVDTAQKVCMPFSCLTIPFKTLTMDQIDSQSVKFQKDEFEIKKSSVPAYFSILVVNSRPPEGEGRGRWQAGALGHIFINHVTQNLEYLVCGMHYK